MKTFQKILKDELENRGYKVELEKSINRKSKTLGIRYDDQAIKIDRKVYTSKTGNKQDEQIVVYTNGLITEEEIKKIVAEKKDSYETNRKLIGWNTKLEVIVY